MTRRRWAVIASIALIVVGVLGLVITMASTSDVRSHIASSYEEVRSERNGSSRVYRADAEPSEVVDQITDAWKPAERRFDVAGWLLRYQREIVAVTARDDGGSTIFVDAADRGYARWYPYVGGWWGPYSGPGEEFRGGGPGAGK
jgi:hypothetical protein